MIARENLLEVLLVQLDQSLECIFKLLSLKYDQADIDTAYYGLKSDTKEVQINAVEFLDNLLKSRLKSAILPLIEYHVVDANDTSMLPTETPMKTELEMLKKLMKNRGSRIKLAALNVVRYSDHPKAITLAQKLTKHKNLHIQRFAIRVYKELKQQTIDS